MKRLPFVILTAFFLLLYSCEKDSDLDSNYIGSSSVSMFLTNNNINVNPTESGLYYIERRKGTGESPIVNSWVNIEYSIFTIENDALTMTTDSVLARRADIYNESILYGPAKIQLGNNIPGLDEGLQLMKEGGLGSLIFDSDLGYGDNRIGAIDAYSPLLIELELIEVFIDPVANEYEKTLTFLKRNDYSTDSTKTGIYFIPLKEGAGDEAFIGTSISLKIKASLLDGRLIYNSNELDHSLGTTENNFTEGLSEGIKLMKEGGKARIIVPYNHAFGIYGKTNYNGFYKVPVPPYSTIVYDVELNYSR